MKVDKFYLYKELPSKGGNIFFGWTTAESIEPFQEGDLIVSYASKSKKVSKEDVDWSKEEGSSASPLVDYEKYFFALTGLSPDSFLERWSSNPEALEESRKKNGSSYRDGEGVLLLNLAQLLTGKKDKFSKFGRIYKRIDGKTFFNSGKKI